MIFTQLASDTFVRANSNPINGSWAQVDSAAQFKIANNLALATTFNIINLERSTAVTWPNNQYSQTTPNFVPITGDVGGPSVRLSSGSQNGYHLWYNGQSGGSVIIQRLDAGIGTTLGSVSLLPLANDVFRLAIFGNQLYGYRNGVLILGPITDSTYSSGSAGMSAYTPLSASNVVFNLWTGGMVQSDNNFASSYRDFINKRGTDDTPPK